MTKTSSSKNFICNICNKTYTYKSWFDKHLETCHLSRTEKTCKNTSAKGKKLNNFQCSNCSVHISGKKNFNEHLKCCKSVSISGDLLKEFNFSDEFFNESFKIPNYENYIEKLNEFCNLNKKNLKICHLNVNSLFLKAFEINNILHLNLFDIVCLNETKLDSTIPDSFIKNPSYRIIRRDRVRNGGGIMVIVKKHLLISNCHISDDFEVISFKVTSKSSFLNVVSCYKPPSTNNLEFLEYLEKIRLNFDTNEPIIIVGDFNINQAKTTGQCLNEFLENNGLKTVVASPTRLCVNKYKVNGSEADSSTLIDHLIVNEEQSIVCEVIGCPFSDHKFVLGAIEFDYVKTIDPLIFYRNFSAANLKNLKNELLNTDLSLIDKLCTIEDKWDYLKSVVIEKVSKCCPLRQSKKNDNKNFNPWFDSELQSLKNKRDYLYHLFNASKIQAHYEEYKIARKEFKALNRLKMKEFFALKSAKDFKNSKKFWNFYKSSIKIKSDVSIDDLENHEIVLGSITAQTLNDKVNIFNIFFTSLQSSFETNEYDSAKYIFNQFRTMKNKFNLKTPIFSFKKFTNSDVETVLKELPNSSSSGAVGIDTRIMKELRVFCANFYEIF
jgi:hypothetical protein